MGLPILRRDLNPFDQLMAGCDLLSIFNSFSIRFPDRILLCFPKAVIGGFELPDFDFSESRVGAPGVGDETICSLVVRMGAQNSLAVADEYFDQVFVDEDAKFEILSLRKIRDGEWRLGRAQPDCRGLRVNGDGQTFIFAVGEEQDPKSFALSLIAVDGDADFPCVPVELRDRLDCATAAGLPSRRSGYTVENDGIVPQGLQFPQRTDAERAVVREAATGLISGSGADRECIARPT